MKPIAVVLVDDHPMMREGLRRLLDTSEDFLVVGEFDTAEEVLDNLDDLDIDLVVMDIRLPGMDGVEATRQLKVRQPDLRVVIVSAFGQDHLMASIDAGADGYLLKTLAPEDLVRSLLHAAQGLNPVDPTLTRQLMDQAATGTNRKSLVPSNRQQEMLQLVAEGIPSKEVAFRLSISSTTLKREFRKVFDLLGVNDRAHAVAEAHRKRLL